MPGPARPAPPAADRTDPLLELTEVLVALALRSVEAAAGPVTVPQFRALRVLERSGPCNATGLAEALSTHASTVTRIADRLVALGLMTRDAHDADRRAVVLEVTEAGRALVHDVREHRAAELRELLAAVGPDDRAALAQALPPLLRAAREQHGELPRGWEQ